MGRDNQPKARQLARREQKDARRASYPRILMGCLAAAAGIRVAKSLCANLRAGTHAARLRALL